MTRPTTRKDSDSVWLDFLEIFYAPTQVFERQKEDLVIFLPLIVLAVTVAIIFYATRSAMEPIFDAEFNRGMAAAMKANPQITPDMMEKSRGFMRQWAGFGVIGWMLIGPPLIGFVLWLAGKFVEAKQEVGAALMVGVFAYFPRILESVLNALQVLVLPENAITGVNSLKLGVSRFLDVSTASPLLVALLARVDLFTLWVTALLAIGLSVTGKVSRSQGWITAGIVWIIGALPGVWGAVRQV